MPVEPGTEVALDLLHLSTSKGIEIAELERIVGRENETKLVAVTTTGLFKGTDVCLIDAAMLAPYNSPRAPSRVTPSGSRTRRDISGGRLGERAEGKRLC